jgi:3-(3-hydroxy-phenyl)propionate hydroxylase
MNAQSATPFDADVLVAGLGPTGDVLAALLAQEGLSVIAVEREPDLYPAPRAAVFDDEIMRAFQAVGVAETILDACRVPDRYQFVTARDEVLLDFEIADHMPTSGWAQSYLLHQPAVERALRSRLAPLGVDVRLGASVGAVADTGTGVTSQIIGRDGPYAVRTRWVVGCDGASSPIREQAGITLFDYDFNEPWLVIDASTDDPGDLPQRVVQICDPRRPVTYLKMCGNRYRWEFMIKPGEDPAQISSDASIRALLAPWDCFDRLTLERRAVYRFHGLVAHEWRRGRILIAGDAAHQMPPFAGQGMCAGVRDAVNLAWKLGMVVRGEADETLLDTYQAEREGHVRAVIETAVAMGRVVCILDEAAAAARDAGMLARKAAGERDIALAFPPLQGGILTRLPGAGAMFPQPVAAAGRLDDRLGPGAWLIGRDLAPPNIPGLRALPLDHPLLSPYADAIEAWLAELGAEAVLVRPDRHVFGAGSPAILVEQWRMMLGARQAAQSVPAPHGLVDDPVDR